MKVVTVGVAFMTYSIQRIQSDLVLPLAMKGLSPKKYQGTYNGQEKTNKTGPLLLHLQITTLLQMRKAGFGPKR